MLIDPIKFVLYFVAVWLGLWLLAELIVWLVRKKWRSSGH